jgi:hypothetical protein
MLRPPFQAALAVVAGMVALLIALPGRGAPQLRVSVGAPDGAQYRMTDSAARKASVDVLPAGRSLRFVAGTHPVDRQAVLTALAAARPEARRLADLVTGVTTIGVGPVRAGSAGVTSSRPDGRYDVRLDLASVSRRHGIRGIARVTWHELAHVIDHALVTTDLEHRLDAATPRGWGCDGGDSGACASRAERFAESFAKWATGDIGVDIYLGYRVPPPDSVEEWGEPLGVLTR